MIKIWFGLNKLERETNIMRIIEKFNRAINIWEEIKFEKLIDGDIFRIFDNGERYVNKSDGNNVWVAIGEPYLNEDNVWTIKTIY